MNKHWSNEEQIHLINAIPSYRQKFQYVDQKEAKRITLEISQFLYQHNPKLQTRIVNAIFERLPYLDNLLAGVFEKHNYAKKNRHLFSSLPRENKSKEQNLCNTRHQYNGAVKEHLKLN
ncbi:hypothetical protein [Metabacillus elymi]|uniref:Uncharacterized protein n=1 Tax=Metabacillus elymi TaxID=2745198 RepID=A0ABX6S9P4_9BACI|nr:hypothetical protein [Metabacillus sp. KUDC1714]QNF29645.1 hypothetical protein HUW50_20410 [Metabacillus sp. KUDC1714]